MIRDRHCVRHSNTLKYGFANDLKRLDAWRGALLFAGPIGELRARWWSLSDGSFLRITAVVVTAPYSVGGGLPYRFSQG